jgi:hypothetical protein
LSITNSAGGMRAILTALKTNNMAAIVMYENVGYVYPQGEGPGVPQTGFGPIEVPLEEFKKLAKVPMQMVWGDNVDKSASYTNSFKMSPLFAQKVNKYGGKAQVLRLPDAGLKGNTHIPFADMNNVAVADLLSKFLAENGLDKR